MKEEIERDEGPLANKKSEQDEQERRVSFFPFFQTTQRKGAECCPSLFERASPLWWDPKFDSDILEKQYWKSSLRQIRNRFILGVVYLMLVSFTWGIFYTALQTRHWIPIAVVSLTSLLSLLFVLFITKRRKCFEKYSVRLSFLVTIVMISVTLSAFTLHLADEQTCGDVSSVSLFALCIQLLLFIYTVIPLPVYMCMLLAMLYSVLYEVLSGLMTDDTSGRIIMVRVFLHLAIHLFGSHILIMTQARMRDTFMKIGHLLLVRKELEAENKKKLTMIHSVMPEKVAKDLIDMDDHQDPSGNRMRMFRPFTMSQMDNVSILFADIVGFTRMSSNKTAQQLVMLLNNLFGRFDELCIFHGCEKISTLGDCYYCVSGCPKPRSDHAACCTNMGLSMTKAIREFDDDTHEDVNMRVGIHTGKVLCGVVGERRFKFDVFSNDVTFANEMESSGKPGKVHISQATYEFLKDQYYTEDGPPVKGVKTHFIIGPKKQSGARVSTVYIPPDNKNTGDFKQPFVIRRASLDSGVQEKPAKVIMGREAQSQQLLTTTAGSDEEEATELPPLPATQSTSTLNSRKDSGISPSRQSSIQGQGLNGTAGSDHRPSGGYYTSSQASSMPELLSVDKPYDAETAVDTATDVNTPLHSSVSPTLQERKQSDMQLIQCVQEENSQKEYFLKPPIEKLSLMFNDSAVEKAYREHTHRTKPSLNVTFSSPRLTTTFDVIKSLSVLFVIVLGCVLLLGTDTKWIVACLLGFLAHVAAVAICVSKSPKPEKENKRGVQPSLPYGRLQQLTTREKLARTYDYWMHWYPWHISSAVLLFLPVLCLFLTLPLDFDEAQVTKTFAYLFLLCLIHFCNFSLVNCWMRSLLAVLVSVMYIAFLLSPVFYPRQLETCQVRGNVSDLDGASGTINGHHFVYEVVVGVLLLLILVVGVNRDFEVSFKQSFHGSFSASKEKREVEVMKNQADWLFNEIIPSHVVEHLKSSSHNHYSENHKDAGVIFASITNFNDLYDESYMGGKEYLRFLNELIADLDELLDYKEFASVEKIKTIGSTYMAASGLNSQLRSQNTHTYQHLFELMDFAMKVQETIDTFNKHLIGFTFQHCIGYSCGDVTAGVIGTEKLYYDIWGDVVNIASRMYSTGVKGSIQCSHQAMHILKERYEFKSRGTIFVKGKDNMEVYLLVGRRNNVV